MSSTMEGTAGPVGRPVPVPGKGRADPRDPRMPAAGAQQGLPTGSRGRLSSGWWGMWTVVATEAALFGYLLFSYFYVAAQAHAPWPPDGPPGLHIALPGTLVLLAASGTMAWAERGVRRGQLGKLRWGLAATVVLGVVFVAMQWHEWQGKPFSLTTHVYGSLFFTVTGFHMAHVVAGLLMLAALWLWSLLGYFGPHRHAAVSVGAVYWHFVTAVWGVVFLSIYISPWLGVSR